MYNLNNIKAKQEEFKNANSKEAKTDEKKSSLTWFKKEPGEYEIRWMPYLDKNEQPFEEIFYNSGLDENRIVSLFQFGMEDPVVPFVKKLDEQNKKLYKTNPEASKEIWKQMNAIKAKPRFYGAIIVRGQEEKGVQAIELAQDAVNDIYSFLTHKNYRDKYMMDVEKGFDFTLTIAPIPGKTFKGKPVMGMKFVPDLTPSKLGTKAQVDEWMSKMPNFFDYFKAQVKTTEEVKEMIENFMAKKSETRSTSTKEGLDNSAAKGGDSISDDLQKQFDALEND